MSNNVIPDKGPSMEDVYDSMANEKFAPDSYSHKAAFLTSSNNSFHKLPNPELSMYVYPHLAGKEEIPIPGYFTVFNAYEKDHYALPNEMVTVNL